MTTVTDVQYIYMFRDPYNSEVRYTVSIDEYLQHLISRRYEHLVDDWESLLIARVPVLLPQRIELSLRKEGFELTTRKIVGPVKEYSFSKELKEPNLLINVTIYLGPTKSLPPKYNEILIGRYRIEITEKKEGLINKFLGKKDTKITRDVNTLYYSSLRMLDRMILRSVNYEIERLTKDRKTPLKQQNNETKEQ
jgi:hypothetical protein